MAGTSELNPTQLLVAAEEAVALFDLEAAEAILKRVLKEHPENTTAMDMLAELYLQLGRQDKAKPLLEKSIAQKPGYDPKDIKSSSTKWMYYAQIVEGQAAVKSYQKGIEVLQSELAVAKTQMDETAVATVSTQIGNAYAAIAEIFITDLCFEDDAMTRCEAAIAAALRVCKNSLEVWQVAANLRLCQKRSVDAKAALMNCLKIIESLERDAMDDGTKAGPPYQTRVGVLKMLIEVGMGAEAKALASVLLAEEDANVEVWYLYGCAAKVCGDLKEAKRLFLAALEMLRELVASPNSSVQMRQSSLRPLVEATRAALQDIKDVVHRRKKTAPASHHGTDTEHAAAACAAGTDAVAMEVE